MPVLSWGHSHYWAGATSGGETPPPDPELGGSAGGSYVPWQVTTVTFGAGFGAVQIAYDWLVQRKEGRRGDVR